MFFSLVLIGFLIVAFLRGRSPEDLIDRPFRLWPLAAIGLILHLAISLHAFAAALAGALPVLGLSIGSAAFLASDVFLLAFLLVNWGHPGFPVLLLGLGLNFVEIAANGGHMPGDPHQLAVAGLLEHERQEVAHGLWIPYSEIGPSTPLAWLGDRIYMPLPFRGPIILSIGDLIIALGCFVFCNGPFRLRGKQKKI